jgi:hypothetical protein
MQYNFTIPGYLVTVSTVTGVFILPASQWIIEAIGHMNVLYSAVICESARLVVFAYVE